MPLASLRNIPLSALANLDKNLLQASSRGTSACLHRPDGPRLCPSLPCSSIFFQSQRIKSRIFGLTDLAGNLDTVQISSQHHAAHASILTCTLQSPLEFRLSHDYIRHMRPAAYHRNRIMAASPSMRSNVEPCQQASIDPAEFC